MAGVETVDQRPLMPPELLKAAIEGDKQVLIEMLRLEEDGGHTSVAIESAADAEIDKNLKSATFMGNTVLHVLCANNHDELASKVCKKDGSLLRARNKMLETPLHYAAKGEVNWKSISALIEFARSEGELILEVLRDRNNHGETALHEVFRYIRNKNTPIPILDKMLEGDPEWAYQVDNDGISSLDVAMGKKDYGRDVYRCMICHLKYQNVSCSQANQPTALHTTLQIAEIAQKEIEVPTSVGINRNSPIHIAASADNLAKLFIASRTNSSWNTILERMINTVDNEGNTPLHIAAGKGYIPLMIAIRDIQGLERLYFTPVRNRKGLTAFDVSTIQVKAQAGNSMVMQELIRRHLEVYGELFNSNWFVKVMPTTEGNESSMTDQLQIIGLGAVLITTVAFAAAFTFPGGYNTNGSPMLAGKYLFKAFMLAITSAFLQSFFCVLMLMIGGLSPIDRPARRFFLTIAMYLFSGGARSMVLSFGLGLYLVLAPANKGIGILILLLTISSSILDITSNVILDSVLRYINKIGTEKERTKELYRQLYRHRSDLARILTSLRYIFRFVLPFVFVFILAFLP